MIREAAQEDFLRLEEILLENGMLTFPQIDGSEGMRRVKERMGRYFLVATIGDIPSGFIRGCYDGSRALIHQLAVRQENQNQGIGRKLVSALMKRFLEDGATTVAVTTGAVSKSYYEGLGFKDTGISLYLLDDIKNCKIGK